MSAKTGTLYWLSVLLDDESLDATETLLMVALADHVDGDDWCFAGIERLAKRARCSYTTAKRRLAALEERGRIVRQRRRWKGNLSVYEYQLIRTHESKGAENSESLGGNLSPRGPSDQSTRAHQEASSKGSPGRPLARAHPGGLAEPPRNEPPRTEPNTWDQPVSESGALPLEGMAPAPPTQGERRPARRDLLFEAVADNCGIDWVHLTSAARGPLNRAVADLRSVSADPEEVPLRAAAYHRAFPDAALTPTALAKHWPALDPAIVDLPRSRPESVDRQRSEFARAEALLTHHQEDPR